MKKNTKGKWHEDMKNQPMQYIKLSQENTQKSGNPKQLMNSENNVDKTKTTQTQHLIKTYEQHGPHQKPGVDSGAP
jgi:predicted transcriptional regulator